MNTKLIKAASVVPLLAAALARPHQNPFAEGDLETAWVQPVTGPAAPRR